MWQPDACEPARAGKQAPRQAAQRGRAIADGWPRMTAYLRSIQVLLWKDLLAEWRSREAFTAALVFALMVLVVFNFALDLRLDRAEAVAPGVLWTTYLFAGLLAPIDRSALFLAKLLANTLFVLLVEIVTLPVFSALFGVTFDWPRLALVALLGALGFCGVGTLFAAMASGTRAREVMLPVLLLPIALPVVIATVKATAAVTGAGSADDLPWLNLLVAFDAIFIALSFLAFEHVVAD